MKLVNISIEKKIKRVQAGEKPRVLDLFAGCGGISLGFHSVGFQIIGAVEIDLPAAISHARNFHGDSDPELFKIHAKPRDITKVDPEDIFIEYGLEHPIEEAVDIIVGGPPCQAFARVGRAKLREVAEHPEAFLKDARSNLYLRYIDYVKAFNPIALLMENVPDVLNFGGHNVAEEVCEVLDILGYEPRYTMLNAVYFGVPEMRERMFLVAFHKSLGAKEWFPKPTHWVELPRGYLGSRQVAMQTINKNLFQQTRYFVEPTEPDHNKSMPAVTAKDALSDLPEISNDSEQKKKKGPRYFNALARYRDGINLNQYQQIMRCWPQFENTEGVMDHVIRYLPRDYKIFERMKPGDQYPEAHSLAILMFKERMMQIEKLEGKSFREGSERYEHEWKNYVPPYDPGKFPNKWRKMEPDMPARTLMAHLGKDSYSHIHYDSKQSRTISVREAARLQSFPDGFVFQGPMNPAFRQIGNAVPPLMAKSLAVIIHDQLRGVRENEK